MATSYSPAPMTPTPPPNPKYHGLLRCLHRGQPRCRRLRGAPMLAPPPPPRPAAVSAASWRRRWSPSASWRGEEDDYLSLSLMGLAHPAPTRRKRVRRQQEGPLKQHIGFATLLFSSSSTTYLTNEGSMKSFHSMVNCKAANISYEPMTNHSSG
jgi:hypothetical protein